MALQRLDNDPKAVEGMKQETLRAQADMLGVAYTQTDSKAALVAAINAEIDRQTAQQQQGGAQQQQSQPGTRTVTVSRPSVSTPSGKTYFAGEIKNLSPKDADELEAAMRELDERNGIPKVEEEPDRSKTLTSQRGDSGNEDDKDDDKDEE